MRDYIHVSIMLCFLMGLFSCEKNAREPDDLSFYRISEIQATYCNPQVSESDATKNEVTDFYYSVVWRTGDEIALVNVTQNRIDEYIYAGEDKEKTNVFRAVSGPYTYTETDEIYAVYPYSAARIDGSNLKVMLTSGLTYTSKSNNVPFKTNDIQVSARLNPASIVEGDNTITMNRLVTLLSIYSVVAEEPLADEVITALTIQVAGCAGEATVLFDGQGNPYLSTGTDNSMKVNVSGTHLLGSPSTPAVSFIPLVPCALNGGIKLVFETESNFVGLYSTPSATLGKNRYRDFYFNQRTYTKVLSEAEATFNKSWWIALKGPGVTPSGNAGGFGNPAGANPSGSDAGGFGNPNGANPGGSNAGGFENPNGANPNGNNAGSFTAE